jgi:predicted nucleic acid-binding protein
VNVYLESNFVLELALLQEQHASCEDILRLSEAGNAQLIIPAYSLVEPYETLIRRHRQRKQMKAELDIELQQLARTATYADRLDGFQNLTALLIDSADEEAKRLEETRSVLSRTAEIIPLDRAILEIATRYQVAHDLSPQDALVYAAVLSHLTQSGAPENCFLNKNSKGFDDSDLVEELNTYNCRLVPRFNIDYQFIFSRIS